MNKITIINGYKEYIKLKEKIIILDNININFKSGIMYGISGKSGSGKTTFLNIIGTIDDLTSGTIIIDNNEINCLKKNSIADLRMKKIGYIFQDFYLNENMTLEENVSQPMYINPQFNKKNMQEKTNSLIEMVGLTERKKHYPNELSGGERQRVCIARALANNPDIILADEPTGNLDKKNEKIIFEMLKNLANKGKCVVVVSHSDSIFEYADKVFKLEEGKLIEYEK